jgi:hypothetical protein
MNFIIKSEEKVTGATVTTKRLLLQGTFCPGSTHEPGQKVHPLSRLEPQAGTRSFVPGVAKIRDKSSTFCPGLWLGPGQKYSALYTFPLPPREPELLFSLLLLFLLFMAEI